MVDTFNDTGLPLSQTRIATTISREPMSMDKRPNFPKRPETTVGWISRNKSRLRSRRNFFLDIPFYRTSLVAGH
jgi:hypothetical protein